MSDILLTYSVPSPKGTGRVNLCKRFKSEDECRGFVALRKIRYGDAFVIDEAMEILDSRQIVF